MEGDEEREERRERKGREERNGMERQGKEGGRESGIGGERRMSEKEEEDEEMVDGRKREKSGVVAGSVGSGVNYLGFPPGPPTACVAWVPHLSHLCNGDTDGTCLLGWL